MVSQIEDYAILSNYRPAAVISRDGSIEWLWLPRCDSPPTFAASLPTLDHDGWALRPSDAQPTSIRGHDGDGFVLRTGVADDDGSGAKILDVMPVGDRR